MKQWWIFLNIFFGIILVFQGLIIRRLQNMPPITWKKFDNDYFVYIKFTDFKYYNAKWQDRPIITMDVREPKKIQFYLKGKKGD